MGLYARCPLILYSSLPPKRPNYSIDTTTISILIHYRILCIASSRMQRVILLLSYQKLSNFLIRCPFGRSKGCAECTYQTKDIVLPKKTVTTRRYRRCIRAVIVENKFFLPHYSTLSSCFLALHGYLPSATNYLSPAQLSLPSAL